MKAVLIILSVLVMLISCGKNWTKTVKGKVLNPVTGEGIANARVILQKEGSGVPSGLKTVEAVYTDANGNFEISSKKLKVNTAQVVLSLDDYYSIGWKKDGNTYSTLSVKRGTNEADYWAVPYGQIKLDINNINCQGANDSMQFCSKHQMENDYSNYSTYRLGCYSYLSTTPSKVPMGYHYYRTKITRGGMITFVFDTIFVPETGIATVHIDY